MRRFVFEYGTAVHLAVLTVAPLLLSVFCEPTRQAFVIVWLSLFAVLWVVMNPSPRPDEWPRDARQRIGWEILRNPFFTFAVVATVLSAICAVNGGIVLGYNYESGLWSLRDPHISFLPGSVSGCGVLPLAGCLGLSVVTLGVRHALGRSARRFYSLSIAVLAVLSILGWRFFRAGDSQGTGVLLGVYWLVAIFCWTESWRQESSVIEFISAFVAGCLLAGSLQRLPTFHFLVFGVLGVVVFTLGVVLAIAIRRPSAWFRTATALVVAALPPAFMVTGGFVRPSFWPLFPDGFLALRDALTTAAITAWRSSPRLGLGLGSFPSAVGLFATSETWQVSAVAPSVVPNGWIQFLFERGLLGAAVLLFGIGLLLADAIRRFLRAGSGWSLRVAHFIGPVALIGVGVVLSVDPVFIRLEMLMPLGALLALTAAAFPSSSEA